MLPALEELSLNHWTTGQVPTKLLRQFHRGMKLLNKHETDLPLLLCFPSYIIVNYFRALTQCSALPLNLNATTVTRDNLN